MRSSVDTDDLAGADGGAWKLPVFVYGITSSEARAVRVKSFKCIPDIVLAEEIAAIVVISAGIVDDVSRLPLKIGVVVGAGYDRAVRSPIV